MRFRNSLALLAFALMPLAACDSLTAPEVLEQQQLEIHFPPSDFEDVSVTGKGTYTLRVVSLYAPEGVVPIATAKVTNSTKNLKLEAGTPTFSSHSNMVCEKTCKVVWDMYVQLKVDGEGEADVTISLKSNPLEQIKFRVIVKASCYDDFGNYICGKG